MNKSPEEQSEKEGNRLARHARTPEARSAGRPANYIRNSLARVNMERSGVYTPA